MKKKTSLLTLAISLVVMAATLIGCGNKEYGIIVSTQDVRFPLEAESQTITVEANCNWSITLNDDADWYTITPMSGGKKDTLITVTVTAMEDADYRGSSFVITSPGGHVRRTVFISQNKLDIFSLTNKVFGVSSLEHWNTDNIGLILEETYKHYEFNPYDTSKGYMMLFYEDGVGLQRDHHNDTVAFYMFHYEYDHDNHILHIVFETTDDAPEDYDPEVLTASDSLFRFMHEYKHLQWERADMRRIGTINPREKSSLMRMAKKRASDNGVFRF